MSKLLHQLENEIGRLDLEAVRQYMIDVDWKWSLGEEGEARTPTVVEMKRTIRDLFGAARTYKEAGDSVYGIASTGGFSVFLTDGDEPIRIQFNILEYRRDRRRRESL